MVVKHYDSLNGKKSVFSQFPKYHPLNVIKEAFWDVYKKFPAFH